MGNQTLKFAFAGDRDIAVDVLAALLAEGDVPAALLLSGQDRASHDATLITLRARRDFAAGHPWASVEHHDGG